MSKRFQPPWLLLLALVGCGILLMMVPSAHVVEDGPRPADTQASQKGL